MTLRVGLTHFHWGDEWTPLVGGCGSGVESQAGGRLWHFTLSHMYSDNMKNKDADTHFNFWRLFIFAALKDMGNHDQLI